MARAGARWWTSLINSAIAGATTAAAVRAFRAQQGLDAGEDVDGTCWSALVDESYKLGDRTLYLRLPNFHGAAVRAFRAQQGLDAGEDVDGTCWSALVDESYKLGDRTLYLRLPNFHGADVRALQRALNTLGFACGVE